ncbi:MAG: sulfotransferase domain-containing protein [bacterium]|nr:sulfotransferase domain-containing protein [bacterium]
MKKIVWLASYPKSGNTWFRIFLSHLIMNHDLNFVNPNNQLYTPIASSRDIFEKYAGFESSLLTQAETDLLRREVYLRENEDHGGKFLFKKCHDAYFMTSDGEWMFPAEATKCSIYLIRNPLDVAVSLSYHNGQGIDQAVSQISTSGYALCSGSYTLPNQLHQRMGSWNEHVKSWKNAHDINVHFMRYEDMKSDPMGTFFKTVEFIGMKVSKEKVKKALELSSMKKLKKYENSYGFNEKPANAKNFFREGKTGNWRDLLTADHIKAIIDTNGEMMKEFNYSA